MYQPAESCTIRAMPSAPFPGSRALLQQFCGFCLLLTLLGGCASYGVIVNQPKPAGRTSPAYSLKTWAEFKRDSDVTRIVSFSGGGTRAAVRDATRVQYLRTTP
jgi:hypothetical protein